MPTILLCQPIHASGMALLQARRDVTIRMLNRPSPEELAAAMPGVHAVLAGGMSLMKRCSPLRPTCAPWRAMASAMTRWTSRRARGAELRSASPPAATICRWPNTR